MDRTRAAPPGAASPTIRFAVLYKQRDDRVSSFLVGSAQKRDPRRKLSPPGANTCVSSRTHARAPAFWQSTGRCSPPMGHLGTTRGHGRERARTAGGCTRDHLVTTGRWVGQSEPGPSRDGWLTRPGPQDGWRSGRSHWHPSLTPRRLFAWADAERGGGQWCTAQLAGIAWRFVSSANRPPATQSRLIGALSDRGEAPADAAPKRSSPRRANGCSL